MRPNIPCLVIKSITSGEMTRYVTQVLFSLSEACDKRVIVFGAMLVYYLIVGFVFDALD